MKQAIAPDAESFLDELRRTDPRDVRVAEALLEWIDGRGLELEFGRGTAQGSFYPVVRDSWNNRHPLFGATTSGHIEVLFNEIQALAPFDRAPERQELRNRLNAIPGVGIREEQANHGTWPSISMERLIAADAFAAFRGAFDWTVNLIEGARAGLPQGAKASERPLAEAISAWDREAYQETARRGAAERNQVLERFPLDQWPTLEVERYALGTGVDSFSRWVEFSTPTLGSVGGGNASKHLIFRRADGRWRYPDRFANETEAWETIRKQLVEAFDRAGADDFDAIGELSELQNGSMTVAKAIYIYNPDKLLPAFARAHRSHFMRLLGGPDDPGDYAWEGCRRLLELVRQKHPEFDGWSPLEIMHFLYWWASPIDVTQIVKIAPGHDASLWLDCRDNGYIRVGWDEVGNLADYGSKDEFAAAFAEHFGALYKGAQAKITEKGNEVWMLTQLQPGDVVVANKGTSHIVGIGRVKEPGYQHRPDLGEYTHTLAVNWQDQEERDIPAIKRWAFKTVARISQADYERILKGEPLGGDGPGPKPGPIPTPAPEPILGEVERALRRKGQVILFGPPGTGKTYTARRFSVWWLANERGDSDAQGALANKERFDRLERSLSTAQAESRVWWVVASPAIWAWERLAKEETVAYRYGRLKRNYPLLQVGDLVVGYQSNPDKRIVALARVKDVLHETPDGPQITLERVGPVANGPTYEELLADSAMAKSEPMRFRNQGTLFALTPEEADYLLAWLQERDPSLPELESESGDAIGPLTRVTFHPSYTYEDFVEGYKPVPTGTGQLDLRLQDGVFKRLCRTAEANPAQPYLLLIDEINRGNIPKIFGELITLLERDKRGLTVVLPQSGESFAVPDNVYLVGTMNTADRSIRLLDAALRRRFAFVELMPDTEPLAGGRVGDLDLVVFLTELNRKVAHTEGREKQIGQSFLLDDGQPVSDPEMFAGQFRHEILPLLQEYAYEDYRELADYLGPRLIDVEGLSVRRDVLDDATTLIQALVSHLQGKPDASPASESALVGESAADPEQE